MHEDEHEHLFAEPARDFVHPVARRAAMRFVPLPMLTSWDELLGMLAGRPRENGDAAIRETAEYLLSVFQRAGIEADSFTYMAHPYRLRIAGIVILLGTLFYAWCMRVRRARLALATAVALPVILLANLDYYVPIFGWIGRVQQPHIEARIGPSQPVQQLVLSAHFDSKTDLLDHVERAPIDYLGLPVILLLLAAAVLELRRRGAGAPSGPARWSVPVAALYGLVSFAALTGGAFVPSRSHGALDDGAACATLVRVAERLAAAPAPLQRTAVRILLLSGEEAGVHGSWEYVRARFAPPPLPTRVINMEFFGASADLAVFKSERFSLRSYPADPDLLALVDRVHRARRGKPIHVTWYGAATDARSFLAHGVPALTLLSDLPGHALARHMHSDYDRRDKIDPRALDETVEFLLQVVAEADA